LWGKEEQGSGRSFRRKPETELSGLCDDAMQVEDIVREGTVTAVNNGKRIAKVWFDALGIQSDWMPVLITNGSVQDRDIIIKPYMPKVNEKVLVLYFPVFNGDGVILGGVKPWQ